MEVTLNPVKREDYEKIFEWRNEPDVRGQMFNQKVVSWDEHEKFWNDVISDDSKRHGFIINVEGKDCGVIRLDISNDMAEVDIFISKKFQGVGVGQKALEKGIQKAKEMNIRTITARIKSNNEASPKIFEKNGFVPKYIFYELRL